MTVAPLILLSAMVSPAPSDLSAIKKELDGIAKGFGGRLGYHLRLLDGSGSIGYRDDERYPSASTIKTVVMIEVFRQIERGELKWTDTIEVPPIGRRNGGMWVAYLREGTKINIDGLVQLMMTLSDNTATVMLADKVGVEKIETLMLEWGLTDTACTINVPASNQRLTRLRTTFANMGVTSPREMATILEKLAKNQAASPAACEKMRRIMAHQYWDDFFAWSIPPEVAVMAKVGALNRSRSDTAIVYGPRPYVLTVYTDNQKDQRWVDENEGNEALRRISGIVWNGLNPGAAYAPKEGAARWYPTGGGVEGGD